MRLERDIKKLYKHKTSVNTDSLWEQIESHVPTEKKVKRKRLLYLWVSLFFLILITCEVTLFSFHSSPPLRSISHFDSQKNASSDNNSPFIWTNKNTSSIPTPKQFIFNKNTVKRKISPVPKIESQTPRFLALSSTSLLEKEMMHPSKVNKLTPRTNLIVPFIEGLKGKVKSLEKIELATITHQEENKENKEENTSKKSRQSLWGVSVGTGFARPSLTSKQGNGLAIKKSLEQQGKTLFTYQINWDYMFSVGKNIWIKTGLSYSRINGKIAKNELKYSYRTSAPSNQDKSKEESIISLDPNHIEEQESIHTTPPTKKVSSLQPVYYANYYHHFLDVPLVLSYELGTKKVRFFVEGGLNVNILHTYNLKERTGNKQNHPIINELKSSYRKNTGLSTYTGLSLHWSVNPSTFVKIGGTWSQHLYSTTKSDYPLNQRYSTLALQLGMMRSF